MLLKSTIQLGLRWVFCWVFRRVYPKKPGRFFWVCTQVSEPW